ncbi:MAG TPA: type II secretion system protein GspK, partial [Gammaproteobacteria bacterium]
MSGPRRSGRSRQRGIVLVVVLWLVALLSLMAVSQTAAVRTETLIVGNLVESATARAAAYAGLQLAVADL